jgi:glycosyltransferase involved in cell wall biosynthesis
MPPALVEPGPRTLILTPYYHPVVGGVETHARQIAHGLATLGVPVRVLTKRLGRHTPARDIVDGIPVARVLPSGPPRGSAKWLMIPAVLGHLVRHRHEYDVVLCPDHRGVGVAALAGRLWTGRPVVLQAATPGTLSGTHVVEVLGRRRSFATRPTVHLHRLLSATYARADAYACISADIVREVQAMGVAPDRIVYLPHAVNLQQYRAASADERAAAKASLGIPARRPVVMFLGRLSREKGVLELVDAWRRLGPVPATLAIVGPDMPDHAYDVGAEARHAALAVAGADIRFLGATDDPARTLRAADVLAQPSHYEAFGISVVQAMACGIAIVASDIGGMRDYLVHEENALLCPPRAPAELATQITRLLDAPEWARTLGQRARRTAVTLFDEQPLLRRWRDLLSMVAAGASCEPLSRIGPPSLRSSAGGRAPARGTVPRTG